MTDTPDKVDPESLALRARPESVRRINRKVLFMLAGTGSVLVLGATMIALDPPDLFGSNEPAQELYNVGVKRTPDALQNLPSRYSDVSREIELGPPLPGDLGGAVLEAEQEFGLGPAPFRPDPMEDAERAERIRQARLAQQGREAGVFFALSRQGKDMSRGNMAITPVYASAEDSDGSASIGAPLTDDQNQQRRKRAFLAEEIDPAIYNGNGLQIPASPYQIMAGSVIAASFVTGINSDLPGQVIAQVTEHVYDSVAGRYLLIPQGSKLIGTYDSVVAFGQERALIVWKRIIRPDGSSILIENLLATDAAGYAGLKDQVDFHTWRLLKGIVLSTLLGVGTELTFSEDESDLVKALRESSQDTACAPSAIMRLFEGFC